MKGVARIRYRDGGLMLPVQSPYDRELLLASLCHRLQRSGVVQLELDGRRWSMSFRAALDATDCAVCSRTARLYGISDARVDGPVCAACLAALLRVEPAAPGATEQPRRGAVAAGGSPLRAAAAPAARTGVFAWARSSRSRAGGESN